MAASLAWGGQRNGYIDAARLISIGRGFLLEATAAAQFLAARAFLIAVYGIDPLDYVSETYRDIDGQEYQKRRWTLLGKPWNAATPGESIHGWAKAIDFNVDAMTDDIYNIIMAVLARYGFIRDFLDIGETWHTSFREAAIEVTSSNTTPFEEDEDMAFGDDQAKSLDQVAQKVTNTIPNAIAQLGTDLKAQFDKLGRESNVDFFMLTINDGEGRYGDKGAIIYALTGKDYWLEIRTVDAANALAGKYGNAANVTYVEWENAKTAAGVRSTAAHA